MSDPSIFNSRDDADTIIQNHFPSGETPKSSSRAFPVPDWDRYEFIAFIGEGGMGRVFKARDRRLKRFVALKFLRDDNLEMLKRFVQEAQTQARIEHEHICKVYEVNDVNGLPYIAMQYIEGISLRVAKNRLTLEEKVKVIKEAAEALQAAHRMGLIHRDIKPANIMVERAAEVGWRSYVMDFGLARELESKDMTVTGAIMGTPAYMAPEQALGQPERLDRRTDVYSLGATLYELLADKPPFTGATVVDVMVKLVSDEPESLCKPGRTIPRDLETIVMKCLEKDPLRRYDSAKALAEDLQRYLDGEPIAGRRAGLLYRTGKWVRKQRLLAGVIGVAALVILSLLIVGVRVQLQLREQAELAQRLTREIKDIEWMMRVAHMMPLHDTRREKAAIHQRIGAIEREMQQLGGNGAGPGNYALGRAYLALREYERARKHLELAWTLGYQNRDVSFALGQVLGEIYRVALEDALRIGNRELREARVREIERELRDPALGYLKSSGVAEVDEPTYVEGLIAFYERDYARALEKARAAFEQSPTLYEARRLAGDVHIVQGKVLHDRGDFQGALAEYQLAAAAYQDAIEIGESDATGYEGECSRLRLVMEVERAQGQRPQESYERALAACDKALRANPEGAETYNMKSRLFWRWSEYQLERGEDPRESLELAITSAQAAARISPDSINPYNNLGNAYAVKGEYELANGLDPQASLEASITSLTKAIELNPNHTFAYNNLGLSFNARAEFELARGVDPRASVAQGIKSFRRALQLNERYVQAYNNIAAGLLTEASYQLERGDDPSASLVAAIESAQQAVSINPNYAAAYIKTGIANRIKAQYELAQGRDPAMSLNAARMALEKAALINQNHFEVFWRQGEVELVAAQWKVQTGASALGELARGLAMTEKALSINAKSAATLVLRGKLELLEAEPLSAPADRRKAALKAIGSFEQAQALNIHVSRECQPYLAQARRHISP